jgi:hypothetical protein
MKISTDAYERLDVRGLFPPLQHLESGLDRSYVHWWGPCQHFFGKKTAPNRPHYFVLQISLILNPIIEHRQRKDKSRNEQDPCREKEVHVPSLVKKEGS